MLTRGDAAAFIHQATVCAELWEFGVCAGLLEDRKVENIAGQAGYFEKTWVEEYGT